MTSLYSKPRILNLAWTAPFIDWACPLLNAATAQARPYPDACLTLPSDLSHSLSLLLLAMSLMFPESPPTVQGLPLLRPNSLPLVLSLSFGPLQLEASVSPTPPCRKEGWSGWEELGQEMEPCAHALRRR